MTDKQMTEHSNRIFVEHERLKIEAANLRDELKQAQAERDCLRSEAMRLMNLLIEAQANENHLRRALEWVIAKMQGADKHECPYPCPDGQHGADGRCLGTLEGCWMIAALAATKEAPDEG